jgi:RimJ/RimL family protein N-acetyltransferase
LSGASGAASSGRQASRYVHSEPAVARDSAEGSEGRIAGFAGLTPPDPPLSDGVVTLRVPDPTRDLDAVSAAPDQELVRWILGAVPRQPPDPAEQFERFREWWSTGTNAFFSIDAAGRQGRVGALRVLFGLLDPYGFAEVGYIIDPHGRGRGYATRAVRLVARWVLDDLGIGRLQARTHPDNVASQRVLERVGFQREGLARSAHVLPVSGERIDCLMWSSLPGEIRD